MKLKVKAKKQHSSHVFSLILEKPEVFDFYPGQYLDIELPVDDPLGKTRIFSISSSPSEDFLMITFKEGFSEYKSRLRLLTKGDIISSSHPAGTVVMDDSAPLVLLSGGIGIAPHRSMVKWAVDQHLNLPITLIYSNSDANFIFKEELDTWQKQLPNLQVIYHNTNRGGRLNKDRLNNLLPKDSIHDTLYYLAGPPAMVDDFEKILFRLGVDSVNIRTDRFDGY